MHFLPQGEAESWRVAVYGDYKITTSDIRDEVAMSILYLYGWWIAATVIALGVTWLGVLPSLWRALDDVRRDYVHLLRSHGRVLPGTVFFTLFLFINADTWQASQYLTATRVLALFIGVSLLATGAQFRREIRLRRQATPAPVVERCQTADGGPDP